VTFARATATTGGQVGVIAEHAEVGRFGRSVARDVILVQLITINFSAFLIICRRFLLAGPVTLRTDAGVGSCRNGKEAAPFVPQANINGTNILVVTVQLRPTPAGTVLARILRSAGIAVIARHAVGAEDATGHCVTLIVRADVAVVAVLQHTGHANARRTQVPKGTIIVVRTGGCVVGVDAAHLRRATIVGARISVRAIQVPGAHARPAAARVFRGARIPVRAVIIIKGVYATEQQIARVGGANVAVLTVQFPAARAFAVDALVSGRARVAVIAGIVVDLVRTARFRVTRVVRTDVSIVAIEGCPSQALPAGAGVARGAGIAIVARRRVGGMPAARIRLAPVISAPIAVVAIHKPGKGTLPLNAMVSGGATVSVVTLAHCVGIHAADL